MINKIKKDQVEKKFKKLLFFIINIFLFVIYFYIFGKFLMKYRTYIAEIKRQLDEAIKQIERIAKLEEVSNMTLEEFCKLYGNKNKI